MAINKLAFDAYQSALNQGMKLRQESHKSSMGLDKAAGVGGEDRPSFGETVSKALGDLNDMQKEKNNMIEAFASGENQNVHELMISLQKASVAMSMTTAVRGKVMETYRELSKISF